MGVKMVRHGDLQLRASAVVPARKADDAGRSTRAIGNRLTKIREVMGLTQTKFARSIGVTQGTVAGWEGGHRPPGLKIGHALCDKYNLTLDYIYRGDTSGLPLSLLTELHKLD